MSQATRESVYSVHPSVAMVQKWITEMPRKTGRSVAEWTELIQREGPANEKECRAWLKQKHGFGTNSAWWLAERALGTGWLESSPEIYLQQAEAYVANMFAGAKAGLRPLYDELLQLALALGTDVKACPCQTIVPLYRKHVFAQLKPATRTRLDLGLALRDTPVPPRLIDTGSFAKKDRLTHRIPLTRPEDIDDEARYWLRFAYEFNAG